jgi:iron(III) transport system ATP-binding protein
MPPVTGQPDRGAEGRPVAIAIRGLSKSFGKRAGDRGEQALSDVDLDVAEGEFLVLLGPSGCGKTTLLRSIAGLETPDQGSINIDGEAMFHSARGIDVDAGTRPVNMIFQSYALWPHMTAARNVAFPLKCAGVPRKEIGPRVQEILDRVGIGQLGDRYPSQMSGGQQQRLALARVLVLEERIVLFDEPLSNVDAQVREKLRLELIKMQRRLGFTAI